MAPPLLVFRLLRQSHVRLSHLSAVAVMIALVGAMFVAFAPAAAATGDVTHSSGVCYDVAGTLTAGIAVTDPDTGDTPAPSAAVTYDDGDAATTTNPSVLCPEDAMAGDWVSITPTSSKPDVEVLGLQVRIDVTGDSDLVVSNDGTASLMATLKSRYHNDASRNLWIVDDSFNVSGELSFSSFGGVESGTVGSAIFSANTAHTAWGDGALGTDPDTDSDPLDAMTIPVRAGTTEGEYTVSVAFLYDHDNDDANNNGIRDFNLADTPVQEDDDDELDEGELRATKAKVLTATKTITVSDAGQAAGSASLDFGPRSFDDPKTLEDESNEGAEFGATNSASSVVRLKLVVLNSLGNAAGANGATGLSSLFVSASGAEITINQIGPGGSEGGEVAIGTTGTHNASANIEGVNNSNFYLNIAPIDDEARSVSVSATIIGQDGSVANASAVDLAFSGDADSITLTNAGDTMFQYNLVAEGTTETPEPESDDKADTNNLDSIAFILGAADSAGNGLAVPGVRVDVTDHEGKRVSRDTIVSAQIDNPGSYSGNNSLLLLNNNASKAKKLGLGEYTVKVTNRTDSTQTAEATFMVVGPANDVSVEVSDMTPGAIGDIVEVTVTVTDENGNPVADDTLVDIDSSDASAGADHVLVETGDTAAQKTDDGVVTATFVAVGPGTSVITAVADGKSAVAVVTSTAGAAAEAMPEEEAGLSCLSSLSGFSTWTCDVEASASEIFDWISSRGATALHLNSNRMWVRYSVVDGAMVPGSSDFMVTKSDILYISN